MDFDSIKPTRQDDGVLVHFRDASGELEYDVDEQENKTPVTARVAGQYSSRHKKITRELREESRKNPDIAATPDAIEERTIAIQAGCIIAWDFTAGGKPFPITAENWGAILSKKPEYEEQITAAIYSYARFFTKPSAS